MFVYNVGGLSEAQEIEIFHVIKTHRIDYAILIDTRRTKEQIKYVMKRVRMVAGPQFRVQSVHVKEHTTAPQRVGGQIHIYRADTVANLTFCAEDRRGALVYTDFLYGHTKFRIVSIYMPNRNDNEGSMWTDLGGEESHNMIYTTAGIRIKEAKENDFNVILGGDFNCGYEGEMRQRIHDMGLNPTGNSVDPSWRNASAASRIDHIFYGGNQITEAWGGPREMVSVLTDHMPVFGIYRVLTLVKESQTIPFRLQPDLKRHDKQAKDAIGKELARLQGKGDAEEDIRLITETTVNAHRYVIKKRSSKKWVDGWSPDMMAIQYAIRSLINIRRHLQGEHNFTRWTSETYNEGMTISMSLYAYATGTGERR
jgi:endonuclease/exonuclease/phosphatase family metal-dependent hydrolase